MIFIAALKQQKGRNN